MFVPAQSHDAFDTCQPFSRAEARAAGLTAEMLLSKRFHKIFWDTYVSRDVRATDAAFWGPMPATPARKP